MYEATLPFLELGLIEALGLIIILSTILGHFARLLRQPTILAYIIAGFILGPFGFALITNQAEIATLSELGIAFLLFVVGLELNLGKLRRVGKEIVFVSLIQVFLTFLITYFLFLFLGFSFTYSFYLGLATSFSSTMVVIKLLSDKKKIGSLRGRLTIGILMIQDILIILVLSLIPYIQDTIPVNFISILMNGIGLIALGIVLNRFIFPTLLRYSAKTRELLFLLSISTVFLFIILSYQLGFSIAIGGFIAGLTLAAYPYNIEIATEVRSLHNFFLAIFFASLGMQLNLQILQNFLSVFFFLFFIVLLIKPLIIFFSLKLFNYEKRIPVAVSIPLAQASEFTFILAQEGYWANHISLEFASLLTTFTLLSIAITPYLFSFSYKIADKIARGKVKVKKEKLKDHVVILGCHKAGKYLIENLKEKIIAVDHDPDVIEDLKEKGYKCIYGDGDNKDILEAVNVKDAKLIISAIPDLEANLYIARTVKEINPEVIVIAKAFTIPDALKVYEEGADYVVIPMRLAGDKLLRETKKILKGEDIKEKREREIRKLREEVAEGFLV
jgi:Kef-type K+ transport system membrane component KefB